MSITKMAAKYGIPLGDVIMEADIQTIAIAMYANSIRIQTICDELEITKYQLTKWIHETTLKPPGRYKGPTHFDFDFGVKSKYRLVDRMEATKKPKCKGDDEG